MGALRQSHAWSWWILLMQHLSLILHFPVWAPESRVLSLGSQIIEVNMSCYFPFVHVYVFVPRDLGTKLLPGLIVLCLGAQGMSRHPLGINKHLWIKSDYLNAWLRSKALRFSLTFFFKCQQNHMACFANVFVNWRSKSLLRWHLCFSV